MSRHWPALPRPKTPKGPPVLGLRIDHKILEEMKYHAKRLDRSLSSVVQQAWKLAYPILKKTPAPID